MSRDCHRKFGAHEPGKNFIRQIESCSDLHLSIPNSRITQVYSETIPHPVRVVFLDNRRHNNQRAEVCSVVTLHQWAGSEVHRLRNLVLRARITKALAVFLVQQPQHRPNQTNLLSVDYSVRTTNLPSHQVASSRRTPNPHNHQEVFSAKIPPVRYRERTPRTRCHLVVVACLGLLQLRNRLPQLVTCLVPVQLRVERRPFSLARETNRQPRQVQDSLVHHP